MGERDIFYIYNLANEKVVSTRAQKKEIIEWSNKKYFQLFGEMLINLEGKRKSHPHCFATEVKALWDSINCHLLFQRSELGGLLGLFSAYKSNIQTRFESGLSRIA